MLFDIISLKVGLNDAETHVRYTVVYGDFGLAQTYTSSSFEVALATLDPTAVAAQLVTLVTRPTP